MGGAFAFLIGSRRETPNEVRLVRLLEFYGVRCLAVRGVSASSIVNEVEAQARRVGVAGPVCAIMSGEVMGEPLADGNEASTLLDPLTKFVQYLFVFGVPSGERGDRVLNALSFGAVERGEPHSANQTPYQVTSERSEITRELTGLSFVSSWPGAGSCFAPKEGSVRPATLAKAGGHPFLLTLQRGNATVFLSAASVVTDLEAPADDNFTLGQCFAGTVPLLMFLRSALGNRVWQASYHPAANLVLDDPLLRPNYGFIHFPSLLQHADEWDFTATLAFIPWNYARSEKSTMDLFLRRADRLEVCVHGCDHIAGEFALTDLGKLNSLISLATCRMEAQEKQTGLGFVKAMVFPQGISPQTRCSP